MNLDQKLVDAAIALIKTRYPKVGEWDGAAALYTVTGKILTSTYPDPVDPRKWLSKKLIEAQPFYWNKSSLKDF